MNETLELHRDEIREVLWNGLVKKLQKGGADEDAIQSIKGNPEAHEVLVNMLELCAVQYQASVVATNVGGLVEGAVDQVSNILVKVVIRQVGENLGKYIWLSAGDTIQELSSQAAKAGDESLDVLAKMKGGE